MSASKKIYFWDDDAVELNDQRVKKNIPKLPTIAIPLQTVKGKGMEALAYLAWQVVKSQDKSVIIRAIASACSCLINDSSNFTGSGEKITELTGLEQAAHPEVDEATELTTNFKDAEPVTVKELLGLMEADADELGAYFGVLFLSGNKRVTTKNRTAFNEKRKDSATSSIIGEAVIFVSDSIYLSDDVLQKVYASFLSYSPVRANMTALVVNKLDQVHMGPSLAFMNMFLLLTDSGMSALKIIKEAVIKHPWIRSEFPELKPELFAANTAQNIIKAASPAERSFLKAIHGSAFVPVNYSDINNLTGVCKEILKRTTPSYGNYDGGKVTEGQLERINAHPDVSPVTPDKVSAE
jgi:hypothetical protein